MAKPWGRYEIGHTRHPKFLALTGNAYALWWEAKNYCDEHHTDGLFRRETLRTFRFNGGKSVELLTRSCGLKPNGEPYAPLWETAAIGGVAYFKMHDYLDHNDCHNEVQERIADAADRDELRRLQARKRKRLERERRKADIETLKAEEVTPPSRAVTLVSRDESVTVTHQTETPTQTQAPTEGKEHPKERESGASLSPPADPFVNPTTTDRAGRFLDRYQELYQQHRHGARYVLRPALDYAAAVALCATWDDDARLDKLAVIFLTTDHKFAEEGSRTVPQFKALASWCDGKLAEYEARKTRTA